MKENNSNLPASNEKDQKCGIIDQKNVGTIAARIVANELEFRGFRVTDLNKDGFSPNVDLLAARDGRLMQIQVKGASQLKKQNGWEDWWVGYGSCNPEIIAKKQPMFNRIIDGCYKAEIVALIAVRTPSEYCSVILPVVDAERAQINLNRDYRPPLFPSNCQMVDDTEKLSRRRTVFPRLPLQFGCSSVTLVLDSSFLRMRRSSMKFSAVIAHSTDPNEIITIMSIRRGLLPRLPLQGH